MPTTVCPWRSPDRGARRAGLRPHGHAHRPAPSGPAATADGKARNDSGRDRDQPKAEHVVLPLSDLPPCLRQGQVHRRNWHIQPDRQGSRSGPPKPFSDWHANSSIHIVTLYVRPFSHEHHMSSAYIRHSCGSGTATPAKAGSRPDWEIQGYQRSAQYPTHSRSRARPQFCAPCHMTAPPPILGAYRSTARRTAATNSHHLAAGSQDFRHIVAVCHPPRREPAGSPGTPTNRGRRPDRDLWMGAGSRLATTPTDTPQQAVDVRTPLRHSLDNRAKEHGT